MTGPTAEALISDDGGEEYLLLYLKMEVVHVSLQARKMFAQVIEGMGDNECQVDGWIVV